MLSALWALSRQRASCRPTSKEDSSTWRTRMMTCSSSAALGMPTMTTGSVYRPSSSTSTHSTDSKRLKPLQVQWQSYEYGGLTKVMQL
eukprot:COSAG04_NODE_1747_length_5715_cov_2.362536_2_plen_88_part_00